jgi:hypothetical protein
MIAADTTNSEKKKKVEFNIDIVSRYIWRGQSWGGNYVAVQPYIEYEVTPKLTIGIWGTTNFKKDHFYSDGVSSAKGYQELDLYLYYKIGDFLQLHIEDYYWPSVSKVEGIDNGYFNYGKNSSKTIDAIMYFDFSEGYKYPFNISLSTLIAGNDYRYDDDGANPKQNFTTYFEVGYTFTLFEKSTWKAVQNIEIDPIVGVILNNQAEYYSYADYNKPSFVDLGCSISKEIKLGHGITMPIFLTYTHNAASKNTELFGKNFLVTTVNFSY